MFEIVKDNQPLPGALSKSVLAIGNFDGVHRGHQAVIVHSLDIAAREGQKALVLTFEPHPRTFFRPEAPVFRLTHEKEKILLLRLLGLDGAVIQAFDRNLASLSAEAFVKDVLLGQLKAGHILAGHNFRFGKGREGTSQFLEECAKQAGVKVTLVSSEHDENGEVISSSRIRASLEQGDIALANGLLGYRWFVEGEVIAGDKRGRALGFPTANIALSPDCRLRHGVYAARALVGDAWFGAAVHYGRRVQFGGGEALLEPYLLDFSGDLYGKPLRVEFLSFLRPEREFADTEALVAQMGRDVGEARSAIAAVLRTPRNELQAKLEEAAKMPDE